MQHAVRFRRSLAGALLASLALAAAWLVATVSFGAPPASGATAPSKGYWLSASDGGIFGFGDATFYGSTGAITLNKPIVGMAATKTGKGYWEVASDGGIFNFGDAGFFGSTGGINLNRPIVGMAATPSGKGYWLVASDGGIFGFGDATFFGSTGAITLNRPIVGMAATPSGKGYWLVASDGGIFNFGDAEFRGSTGALTLARPIVGMAATPSGKGYWLVASDGGIFNFGDAGFLGSTGALKLNMPVVAMAASPTGLGYWLVASDGGIFNFGDAGFFGSTGAIRLNRPIVAIAAGPGVPVTTVDTTKPTVTVKQALAQVDPTNASPVNFTVTFSEPVTGFTSADVTVGGTAAGTKAAAVTGSGATYNVAVSGMTGPGTVTVSVPAGAAIDAAGNLSIASTTTDNSVTFDATAPTVTANQAAGQTDPGSGAAVNFTVTFSEAVTGFTGADVTVGGTAGGTTATVTGSGATYNVAVGGMTTNGTVTVAVAAGAASDAAGNTSAASTSTDNTVTWDGTSPTVTGVTSSTADAVYNAGDSVSVQVGFSEAVVVTGTPTLALNSGGSAAYTSGSGTSTLTFTYTVGAGQNAADLDYVATGSLALAGGTIRDAAGNAATLTLPTPGVAGSLGANKAIVIDTTAPAVTGVTSSTADGAYNAGDVISVQVGLSEAVVVTGTPTLALNSGGTAAYTSGSGTSTLTFTYTVGAGENAADLDYAATGSLALAGGTITDAAGNAATLTLPAPGAAGSLGANKAIVVDTTAPAVTGVTSSTADGAYNAGDVISVQVSFGEAVAVTGTPTLALDTGGAASYASGSGTSTLTFTYTVAGGENTADLDYAATGSLALAGGTITDAAGNAAVLTLPAPGAAGSLGANKAIVIDTTAPVFQSIAATMASTTVTATFSEPLDCATVAAADFLATVAGTPAAVSAAACTPATDDTVDLTLGTAPLGGASVVVSLTGDVRDVAGNAAATVARNTTATTDVTVTIDQAGSDPTSTSPIEFTVVFSESVTGFVDGDVVLGGTAGGPLSATVSGGPATYTVQVTGMSSSGTVTASIGAAAAVDLDGNLSAASTSTDNTVTWDVTAPTVTVNQAVGQVDPTNTGPVNFTVVFSEPVTNFVDADVSFVGSTAGGTLAGTVSGGPSTYNVAVSGMTTSGSVVLAVPATVAADAAGNGNAGSTSTDNTVTWDVTAPTVTVNQAGGQADPTNTGPVDFTVVFSEAVTGFDDADVSFTGSTAGGTLAGAVTGGPITYNVAVTGMTTDGTVVVSAGAGAAADAAGNTSAGSTSTDNTVTWDVTAPTVTVEQAGGQPDPDNASPIQFTVTFSEPVSGFANGDISFAGSTAGGALAASVGGGPSVYTATVTGMTTPGDVVASLGAAAAADAAGNTSAASTSTDNTVAWDDTDPTVTVNQAVGQADPTNASPVNFTVTFSEAVTGFDAGDVTLGGTAGATTAVVTGSGTTYNVAVSGMTTDGTVTASVGAGLASDAAGNTNAASTSTDNTVTRDTQSPALASIAATVGSSTVVATFGEPLLCSSVSSTDFLAAIGVVPVGVASVTCTGVSDASIDVILASPVAEASTTTITLTAGSVTDPATNASGGAATEVAGAIELDPGSTADGATVGPLDPVTYSVTATDTDGTITGISADQDGTGVIFGGGCVGIGTATATCDFSSTLLPGPHVFTFVATDSSGNTTTTTRTVTVTIV